MKYKRRKKGRYNMLIIACCFIALSIFLTTGYALPSGTLGIDGYAIMLPHGSNKHFIPVNDYFLIICDELGSFANTSLKDSSLTILSQGISEDGTPFINYKINVSTGKPRTEVITFSIMNNTATPLTNGTITSTYSPSNTSVIDGNITGSLQQTLEPHGIRRH